DPPLMAVPFQSRQLVQEVVQVLGCQRPRSPAFGRQRVTRIHLRGGANVVPSRVVDRACPFPNFIAHRTLTEYVCAPLPDTELPRPDVCVPATALSNRKRA